MLRLFTFRKILLAPFISLFILVACGAQNDLTYDTAASPAKQQFDVIAYFPSWASSTDTIDFSIVTQINYSFVLPKFDGGLTHMPNQALLKQVFDLAKKHNLNTNRWHDARVFISIGGAESRDQFETLSMNPYLRGAFVDNVVNMLDAYGFDGVDIDWEYPTHSTEEGYISLLHDLHQALSPRGKLVSIAVANYGGSADRVLEPVGKYVDTINVMAYELKGFSAGFNHYQNGWDYWIDRTRIPDASIRPEQIIMGIPFYAMADIEGDVSYVSYQKILQSDSSLGHQEMGDIDGGGDFINYYGNLRFNGRSLVQKKVEFSKEVEPFGGVMIWELSQDSSDQNLSLLQAIGKGVGEFPPTVNKVTVSIKRPRNKKVVIALNSDEDAEKKSPQ